MKYFVIDTNRIHKKIILVPFVKKKKSSNLQFHEKKSHYFQLLEMILVKLLWIVFTKKMLSKGEINTRPCVKFVKAIPNDVWINSKICKRLLCVYIFLKISIFAFILVVHLKKFATNFSSNWRYILCSWKTTFEIYQQQHSLQNQWFSTIYYYILKKEARRRRKNIF